MNAFVERLAGDFADKEFAHGYMEDHGNSVIAAQIKVLREQRGLSQKQLAQLAGMKQESISRLEDVCYNGWTVKTLRKLAEAFDVHLKVQFAPFSEAIKDVEKLSREQLQVESRADDLENFRKRRAPAEFSRLEYAHRGNIKVIVLDIKETDSSSFNQSWRSFPKEHLGQPGHV